MLYERHSSVFKDCPRAARGSAKLSGRCCDCRWRNTGAVDNSGLEGSVCEHGQGKYGAADCFTSGSSHGIPEVRGEKRTWGFHAAG